MPATSLSSLITDLVASMESTVASLREHEQSERALRRLLREVQLGDVAGAPPGAPALPGTRLGEKCPEQGGGDERGVAIDHPVADRACAVR